MPRRQFGQNELTIKLDASLPVFSKRLTKIISVSGIITQELGVPRRRREMIGWTLKLWQSRPKIVHYLWGGYHPLIYIISKLLRKKVIIQWIGTDVLEYSSNKKSPFITFLRKIAYRMVDLHLADFDPLADELKLLGIHATVVSLPPDIPLLGQQDITWPFERSVLVYLPEGRQEFYGSDIIFRLVKEMPDINFLITRHSGKDAPQLPNVQYLGWVDDIESIWVRVKIYIRLVKHDGLSHTVIEALARSKHVIWSYGFPYCHQARSFEEARDSIRKILKQNQPNIGGMHYIYERFESSRLAQDYRNIYLSVLGLSKKETKTKVSATRDMAK